MSGEPGLRLQPLGGCTFDPLAQRQPPPPSSFLKLAHSETRLLKAFTFLVIFRLISSVQTRTHMGSSCGKQLLWSDFQSVLLDISCQVISKISRVFFLGGDLRNFSPWVIRCDIRAAHLITCSGLRIDPKPR